MIERLMVLKLVALDCEAEALLNGVPLARAHPGRPQVVVPVHEYTLAGSNRLELVVWPHPPALPDAERPAPKAVVAQGGASAHARLLLPRVNHVADESVARTLGQIDWAPADGTVVSAPHTLGQDLQIPVQFPRWRWLEAPVVPAGAGLAEAAAAHLAPLVEQLAAGQPEPFLAALRLRTEEVAAAYQRDPREDTERLRQHLLAAHAEGRLRFAPLDGLALRRVAGGRLLEVLTAEGAPALRTEPDADGRVMAWPLRMASVENRFYVLR